MPSARGWIYELKHDGFRCLISKRQKIIRLESRSGCDMGAGEVLNAGEEVAMLVGAGTLFGAKRQVDTASVHREDADGGQGNKSKLS
jgi:hypothetical protein